MKTVSTVLAVTFALASSAAFAGDEKMDHGTMDHGKMMENCEMHGAATSPAEQQKMMDEMFGKIDLDKDGLLSKDEFAKHHEAMRAEHQDRKEKKEGHDHAAEHKGRG